MAKYVFGIDLGTTYSCIAYVDETGRATVINNMEGTNTTPSVVNFASPTNVVVGQVAKENAVIDPQNTVSLVKTLIGRSDFAINYNGEDKSPEEVSAYILRKIASDASKMVDSEVNDVVITCPAYFGTAERTATKNAGIISGLNVLEIISEPTAAALYYGCSKEQENKTILVYDLGGGTFDVTIMSISPDKIEVICSDGNHELGGKDWDEALMRYLAGEFATQTGFDGEFDEYAQQDLRLKAEKAKQQLSSREEVPVMLDAAGLRSKINVSRVTFNGITSALLNETIIKTDAAIAVAKSKGYGVGEILLVGGSTYMPQVPEILKQKYGMEPKILEPNEAVAKGAAIRAVDIFYKNLPSPEPGETPSPTPIPPKPARIGGTSGGKEDLLPDIIVTTTKSYALRVLVDGDPKCCNMIIKNETLHDGAVSVTRQFGTASANMETAELIVFENDFMEEYFNVDDDYILGTASLKLPGDLPEGSPIEVTFTLNTEGILEITGRDLTSRNEVQAAMQAKGIMTKEKVDELKEKSKDIIVM